MDALDQGLGWKLSTLQGQQLVLKDLGALSTSKDKKLPQVYWGTQFEELYWSGLPYGWNHNLIHSLLLWLVFMSLKNQHNKT